MRKRIGVLAIQGAFEEHIRILQSLGAETVEIRKKDHLASGRIDGLVIPGGESTVMGKLLRELGMCEVLKDMIESGLPVFGTCAGLILLADEITNDCKPPLGTMGIRVKRNAYGRQLGSFRTDDEFKHIGNIPMVFIRAPLIEEVMNEVEILATVDNRIVAARQKNMLVTSFHPELTNDTRVHQYFLNNF